MHILYLLCFYLCCLVPAPTTTNTQRSIYLPCHSSRGRRGRGNPRVPVRRQEVRKMRKKVKKTNCPGIDPVLRIAWIWHKQNEMLYRYLFYVSFCYVFALTEYAATNTKEWWEKKCGWKYYYYSNTLHVLMKYYHTCTQICLQGTPSRPWLKRTSAEWGLVKLPHLLSTVCVSILSWLICETVKYRQCVRYWGYLESFRCILAKQEHDS